MLEIQKFALSNIYCAPSQDRKFSFTMMRVNALGQPLTGSYALFNKEGKALPDKVNAYHVFIVGNLSPVIVNLLRQQKDWFKDVWVNVAEDMVARNYIFKVYNANGVVYPRQELFYSFIDESCIVVALNSSYALSQAFNVGSFSYMQVYSNTYFTTPEFNSLPSKLGIKYDYRVVSSNTDKVALQSKATLWQASGGQTLVYVNGFQTDAVTLNIPNNSYVELVYDQSILSKEVFPISALRTFTSTKDTKLKYLLFRDKIIDRIQYEDDNEVYVATTGALVNKGLFYYQHKDYALRNVTDKDYSLYTTFVDNQAQTLSSITTGSVSDKALVLYTRRSGLSRPMIFSSLKLHELYKLPQAKELDVMTNVNYTLSELRADTLENSAYFKVASVTNLAQLTPQLCTAAIGYNGVTYYFANTPIALATPTVAPNVVNVPYVYQSPSTVFEYDTTGKYLGTYTTTGPNYVTNNANVKHVEFLYGQTPTLPSRYYAPTETLALRHNEYRVISATFSGVTRLSVWQDITANAALVNTTVPGQLTLAEASGKKAKVVYLNEPNVYDEQLVLTNGSLYFPLKIMEDRGTGAQLFPVDVPYTNVELFLNDSKLVHNLDFFIDYPNVCICNKTYLDYTKSAQRVNIRMYGFTLDPTQINKTETSGYVNNGVLTRNNTYDVRQDRVYSVYVGGKLYDRLSVLYAEDDNTVRLASPLNGLPYTIKEPFIALKGVTKEETLPLYLANIELNKKLSQLFNVVFPEPSINPFNVIAKQHFIHSPTVSRIINDIVLGVIQPSVYTTPYNDATIIAMLDTTYKSFYKLDPVKANLPTELVEIHPHLGNSVIELNLFQYRFVQNVIRIITAGNISRINISGYLSLKI